MLNVKIEVSNRKEIAHDKCYACERDFTVFRRLSFKPIGRYKARTILILKLKLDLVVKS